MSREGDVEPVMCPLSTSGVPLVYHWYAIGIEPTAIEDNGMFPPGCQDWPTGCNVKVGGSDCTSSSAPELVALPELVEATS